MCDPECGICLGPADPGAEEVVRVIPCGHVQHLSCLNQWGTESHRAGSCPSCWTPTSRTAAVAPPEECPICLANLANGPTLTTPCHHTFHDDCLREWGRESQTCPVCRAGLVESAPLPAADFCWVDTEAPRDNNLPPFHEILEEHRRARAPAPSALTLIGAVARVAADIYLKYRARGGT